MRSNSDEVEKNNDCFRNLHLTTAYGGASPQGEALKGSDSLKKIIIWGLIALVIIICLCIPYWVDDFACEQYKIEVEKVIAEVDDISMIDTLNGCGNVANGNHTYLIVTALIETEYQKEIVKDKFPDAHEVLPFEELHFETKTNRQFSKYVTDNSKKYYVLVYAKSAPFYYLDLRGH